MSVPLSVAALLDAGLHQLGLTLENTLFLQYLELLQTWNKAYNLTAVREKDQQVGRHLLDSLAVLPWIHGTRVLDVGTGAGLPGIPLLLARPQLQMVLLDSNGKKIRFLREVKRALGLNQLEIVEARVEDYHPPLGFDTVVSRAFSELGVFVALTEHLVNPHGHWLALKGRYPEDELVGLHYQTTVHEYDVPGVDGARCCVVLKKGD